MSGALESGDLDSRVAGLETTLEGVARTTDADGHDTLQFEGMNVQVVNGTGTTDGDPNGLGNLIVGYNEDLTCNPDDSDCPWFSDDSEDDRTGSHMLVTGIDHTYTRFGGLLAGADNTTTGDWAAVSGGQKNVASGRRAASVSGGRGNEASGLAASVSGGEDNVASDFAASVSGGAGNEASELATSVSGGRGNEASDLWASVSGGLNNVASGRDASVSGGAGNEVSGDSSSILGGVGKTVSGDGDCHPSC